MNTQHTPGPWFIEDRVPGREIGHRAIVDAGGFTLANPSPMGEANARLIAAAPELLLHLQRLVRAIDRAPANFADGLAYEARAAIARATRCDA